jgi:hypothetical protein
VDWFVEVNVPEKCVAFFFSPEDGGSMLLRSVSFYEPIYTAI